ncbi:Metallo-hydrolase/oxidoreductase [Ascobolus immersus RN42]|uniref:Metallo-hydrolase/oxidoreductase n=1 Tax=Ascobolus immersus RN42 TaxID=1160509 RepID=A0A3N4IA69_ASCIM|nr:Metallo-hydrolase/oxidoreductase [Ascobolus immersus RN42]
MSAIAAETFSASVSNVASPKAVPDTYGSKAHHLANGKGFTNPWPSLRSLIIQSNRSRWHNGNLTGPSTKDVPFKVRTPKYLPSRHADNSNLRATWLGHACYFVEYPEGLRVLFDPVFSQRCSPISFLGPKRFTDIPGKIADIPIIDAVCISHNHYDHLDLPTIKEIHRLHPSVFFFVPLGNKAWFTSIGIKNCIELDWFESRTLTLTPTSTDPDSKTVTTGQAPGSISATIELLPCQHTSNRGLFDRSLTLWGSYSVSTASKSVYFAGDTGYRTVPKPDGYKGYPANDYEHPPFIDLDECPAFKTIGDTRGPFDLGLIPIGAYKPRWLFSCMHADPRDAARIFQDTRCKKALAMHWGTWVLTDEDVEEPPVLLRTALKERGIEETGVFDTIAIGESREF